MPGIKRRTPALIAEVKRLRDVEGLNFERIAERIGVSRTAVADWYTGRSRKQTAPRTRLDYWSDPIVMARLASRLAEEQAMRETAAAAAALYDIRDMDITARVMGDPPPGRSSLASRGTSDDLDFRRLPSGGGLLLRRDGATEPGC